MSAKAHGSSDESNTPSAPPGKGRGPRERRLLAVDLGIMSGFAVFDGTGRLLSYRSQNFGSAARLRRAVSGVLRDAGPGLTCLVLEGPRNLAEIWARPAARRGLRVLPIHAHAWREPLLFPRQQRSGPLAKRYAVELAGAVIRWSGAPAPTPTMRHDAAEAILAGLWGVLQLGWLEALPDELSGGRSVTR